MSDRAFALFVVAVVMVVGAGTVALVQENRAKKPAPKPNYLPHSANAELRVGKSVSDPLVRFKAPLVVDADTGQVWHLNKHGEWDEVGWLAPQLRTQGGAK